MSKLKENIDRILGSSLRCLLPSYWWKRIFGLLVEEIDDVRSTANSKATKSEVASLSNSVDALSDKVDKIDSGNNITVDSELSLGSTNPVQNKVVTDTLRGYILFPLGNAKEFITSYFSDEKPRARGLIWSVNSYTGNNYSEVIGLKYGNNQYAIYFTLNGSVWRWIYDGTTYDYIREEEVFKPDTYMSDSSTNPVQNKVIKKYVDAEVAKKVDKVSGKGLSTEDFTTLLKTKLEGLENYDDTTLTNAINSLETRLNTLVSGDTSTAIESFNEVVAFLENLTDTQDLSSIIASIEQQINTKQDKVNDLEDIRSGASLGKTSLQEHQDISHLATKEELQNVVDDILENEEVYAAAVNDLNSRLVETNATIDTEISTRESLATEVQTLINRVTSNEEVTATSYNELNERINNNYQEGIDTYATKAELNNEIVFINTAIVENEEVIAATLNDLLSQIEALKVRIEQLENA